MKIRSLGRLSLVYTSALVFFAIVAGPGARVSHAQASSCGGDACVRDRAIAERRREIARLRAEMESLLESLSASADSSDPRSLLLLQRKLSDAMRQLEVTRMLIEAGEPRVGMPALAPRAQLLPLPTAQGKPRGWIGISLSASLDESESPDGDVIWRFYGYPVVESVDPGSPAKRAGIEVGDVLLAFNDRDLAKEVIPHDEILTPGKRMQVRLRRGEQTRTLALTVMEIPNRRRTVVMPIAPRAPQVMLPSKVVVQAAPEFVGTILFGSSTTALLGAELMSVSGLPPDFARALGKSEGLYVLNVGPGTAAARAGLRDGDLIVSAAGKELASARQLQRAMSAASSRNELPLGVLREKKEIVLTLRW